MERDADAPPLRAQVALQGQARESLREVGHPKHRLFVPIVRQNGRNGSDDSGNGDRGNTRGSRRRVGRSPRKKPAGN